MINLKRNENELILTARQKIDMRNLKVLIKEHNYTVTKVAMNVGVNDSTLYEYMKNTAFPSLPVLMNLADFFKCNIDYLIGRTNDPAMYDNYKKEEVKAIIKMIEELTNEEKEFVNALLKEINKKKDKISN